MTMSSFAAISTPPPTSPPWRSPSPSSASPAAVELYAQPSDVALVNEVLRPWITSGVVTSSGGGAAGASYVHAADLYAADPDRLAARFRPAVSTVDGERAWYFLSPLRCRSPRDRRKVRAVADGAGCWHSEAAPKHVVEDGGGRRRVVGYRQSFSFMRRGAATGAEGRTGWIMAEFHLHQRDGGFDDENENGGDCGGGKGRKVEGLVLCKMYRSPRNRGHVVVDDGDVRSGVPLLGKRRPAAVVDDEDFDAVSSAARLQRRRHGNNNSDGIAPPPRILNKKAAAAEAADDDDEAVSGGKSRRRSVVVVEVDGEESDALAATAARLQRHGNNNSDSTGGAVTTPTSIMTAPPPLNKKAEATDGGDSSGAAESSELHKATAAAAAGALAPAPAPAAQLQYCPQCGFHLAALQAIVTLAKTGLDLAVARGDVVGDYSEIGRRFRRELPLNTES